MASIGLQRLQTSIPPQYSNSYDPDSGDAQDSGGDFTARPSNARNHSDALWFQPRDATTSVTGTNTGQSTIPSDSRMQEDIDMGNQSSSSMTASRSSDQDQYNPTPILPNGLSRPLTQIEQERMAHLERLKFFLATAPGRWDTQKDETSYGGSPGPHPALNRFGLPSQEYVTCILWNGLYHITGTDIVRALVFRFEAFGRPVKNMKKFEEGVFSDLRNLKPGVDASLEEPKSPFLDLLFKYQCIRTQKKQKVFYWFSVPHDRLFLDALERDLKREKSHIEPTTAIEGEPALSFTYDPKRSLYEQFVVHLGAEGERGHARGANRTSEPNSEEGELDRVARGLDADSDAKDEPDIRAPGIFSVISLTGTSTYKQRRKKTPGLGRSFMGEQDLGMGDEQRGRYPYRSGNRFMSSADSSLSLDRSGYDSHDDGSHNGGEPISAADMFFKQARGELVAKDPRKRHSLIDPRSVGVWYEGKESQNAVGGQDATYYDPNGMTARGRSVDAAAVRASYNREYDYHQGAGSVSAGYANTTFESATNYTNSPPGSFDSYPVSFTPNQYGIPSSSLPTTSSFQSTMGSASSTSDISALVSSGAAKTHPCPLLSCGRTFKRMEHLKRHLRTHTMERPFVCPRCNKRFSRSDNLGQHLRVHGRDGSLDARSDVGADYSGGADTGSESSVDGGMMDELADGAHYGSYSGNEGSVEANWGEWIKEPEDLGDADNEGQERGRSDRPPSTSTSGIGMSLGMFGGESGIGMGMGMGGMAPVQRGSDVQMGDSQQSEEGQDVYYPRQSISSNPSPSPAFSTMSMSSPVPQQSMSLHQQQEQYPGQPPRQGSGDQYLNVVNNGGFMSASAPSHRQVFDHSTLYPRPNSMLMESSIEAQALNANLSTNGGAVRRHRSMTPSVMRTNSGGYGSRPGSSHSMSHEYTGEPYAPAPSTRGYHPYTIPGRANSGSATSSAASSPSQGAYLNLDAVGMRRSDSRASSLNVEMSNTRGSRTSVGSVGSMQEQLRQQLSLTSAGSDGRPGSSLGLSDGAVFGGDIFRSDSPASFVNATAGMPMTDSPARFAIDLPQVSSSYTGPSGLSINSNSPHFNQPSSQYHQQVQHAATAPVISHYDKNGNLVYDTNAIEGYQPQHVSTL